MLFVFCSGLSFVFAFSQSSKTQTSTLLQQIEQNNNELQTFKKYAKSKILALKSKNVLPNPEAEAYFLSLGNNKNTNHTEIEIKQSFEFPTVYAAKKKLTKQQEIHLEFQYQQKRQEVLLKAKQWIQTIIATNKLEEEEQKRLNQAKKVLEQNEKLFSKGQIGILELNKAKIAFVKLKFKVQKVHTERQNALLNLKNLNGGRTIEVLLTDFEESTILPNRKALWQERLAKSKALQVYKKAEEIAEENLKVTKQQNLPNWSLGYVYQNVDKNNLQGFFAGISIPLWGNKVRKKVAQSNIDFQKSNTKSQLSIIKNKFDSQYSNYQILLSKFKEYKKTLKAIHSEELLYKAYKAGEINFSEYFVELEFYHNAHDTMLDMEKELHLIKSQLLIHQL